MIYVDRPYAFPHKRKRYCHLMADSIDQLHEFAAGIGVKRCWFDRYHYDLNEDQFHDAVLAGAEIVRTRDLVRLRQKIRSN